MSRIESDAGGYFVEMATCGEEWDTIVVAGGEDDSVDVGQLRVV